MECFSSSTLRDIYNAYKRSDSLSAYTVESLERVILSIDQLTGLGDLNITQCECPVCSYWAPFYRAVMAELGLRESVQSFTIDI